MDMTVLAQLLEAAMMVCFGISWPISIIKTVRVKNPSGKSLIFTCLVITGYLCGVGYKLIGRPDWVIVFYLLNASFAATDLALCLYYNSKLRSKEA